MLKLSLEAQRRIFQSQLSALLHNKVDFLTAVSRIEDKASSQLKVRIQRARSQGTDSALLTDGLVEQGLFLPEMSLIVRSASALKIDAEDYLRKNLRNETELERLQSAVTGPIHNVVWTFALMFAFFLFSYVSYRAFIYPSLFNMIGLDGGYQIMPSKISVVILIISFILLGFYTAFIIAMYAGLKMDRSLSWSKLRFLWSVPWIRRLYRKRITWRIFSSCKIMLSAGVDPATALETSLRPRGLSPLKQHGISLFPESPYLDAASVGAANLGASLETLEAQLDTSISLLENELPFAAQSTARVIYYVGYVVMGIMVCAMLMQMYDPIFRMSLNIE